MSGRVVALSLVCLAVITACSGIGNRKPPTAAAAERFHVPADVGTLATDATAFAAFPAEIRPTLERESTSKDPETAKARLFVLAMLDGLDEKWPSSLAYLDRVRELEAKPEDKAMTGVTLRVWTDVAGDTSKFRAAFESRVTKLPREKLVEPLAMLRTMGQEFTPDVCRQLLTQEVSPHVKDGTVDIEQVHAIVFQRYAVVRLVPVGKDIDEALGALGVQALTPAE